MKFAFYLILIIFFSACHDISNNKTNSNNKRDWEDRAYNYYKDGDYTNSYIYYNKLIQFDSLNGQYFFGRASTYLSMGRTNEAIKDFLKSVDLGYKVIGSYFNIGLLNTYTNDSIALFYFKKALDFYPTNEPLPTREDIQKEYEECLARLKR